eukprot:1107559-Prymnesium_polylepis.1
MLHAHERLAEAAERSRLAMGGGVQPQSTSADEAMAQAHELLSALEEQLLTTREKALSGSAANRQGINEG